MSTPDQRESGGASQAAQELQESEARYSTLFENVPEAIVLLDVETGRFVDANENAVRLFGVSRADLLQHGPADMSPPRQPDGRPSEEAARGYVERAVSGQAIVFEWLHRKPDGVEVPCEVRLVRMPKRGRTLVCGTITDITERRRKEHALRLTKRSVDSCATAIFWVRSDGHFIYANDAACSSVGYTRSELLEMTVPDIAPHRSATSWTEYWERLKRGGGLTFQSTHRHKSGEMIPVEIHTNYFRYENEEYMFAFVADITGRKRAEEALRESERRLRHSQKAEAVGLLAGGVAHDFNNLLTVILGYAEHGASQLPDDHPVREALARVEDAARQAEGVTRALLTFSRQEVGPRRAVKLTEVVQQSTSLLDRAMPAAIDLRVEIDPAASELWVLADPAQLGQAVMNLALNARDAMPGGGVLRIRVDAEPSGDRTPSVRLTVADTGPGIPSEIQSRIFEPYFTTKARSKGTGLGLSITHGIVESHGGSIEVRSGRQGTTFHILLPGIAPPVDADGQDASELDVAPVSGRVLVAEDEPLLCRLLKQVIESMGFEVTCCNDGSAALQLFRSDPGSFTCLALDHDLPGLTGTDCARQVREDGSRVPILIVSGAHDVEHAIEGMDVRLLRKPFGVDHLRGALREVVRHRV